MLLVYFAVWLNCNEAVIVVLTKYFISANVVHVTDILNFSEKFRRRQQDVKLVADFSALFHQNTWKGNEKISCPKMAQNVLKLWEI